MEVYLLMFGFWYVIINIFFSLFFVLIFGLWWVFFCVFIILDIKMFWYLNNRESYFEVKKCDFISSIIKVLKCSFKSMYKK